MIVINSKKYNALKFWYNSLQNKTAIRILIKYQIIIIIIIIIYWCAAP